MKDEMLNKYVCLYRGKEFECEADTVMRARDKAVCHFRVKKHWEINVVLVELGGVNYIHSSASL